MNTIHILIHSPTTTLQESMSIQLFISATVWDCRFSPGSGVNMLTEEKMRSVWGQRRESRLASICLDNTMLLSCIITTNLSPAPLSRVLLPDFKRSEI